MKEELLKEYNKIFVDLMSQHKSVYYVPTRHYKFIENEKYRYLSRKVVGRFVGSHSGKDIFIDEIKKIVTTYEDFHIVVKGYYNDYRELMVKPFDKNVIYVNKPYNNHNQIHIHIDFIPMTEEEILKRDNLELLTSKL
jgi:hypothetical protein